MASMTRAQRREYEAKQRRLRKYRERLKHEQRRAQRFLHALEQALFDLGLPEHPGGRGRVAAAGPSKAAGKHLWGDVPHLVWVPECLRADASPGLG